MVGRQQSYADDRRGLRCERSGQSSISEMAESIRRRPSGLTPLFLVIFSLLSCQVIILSFLRGHLPDDGCLDWPGLDVVV